MASALIIVDVQNDFVEGGSLGVDGGKDVAGGIVEHLKNTEYDLVVTTQDWHIDPGTHWSETPDFVDSWPVHCEAGTLGAELVENLESYLNNYTGNRRRVLKGLWTADYSGFQGDDPTTHKGLADLLRGEGITNVDVVGIATDHCVKATALDALTEGFDTTVLSNLVAGVNKDDSAAVLEMLAGKGVFIAS